MGILIAFLGFIGVAVAWAFFSWQPPYANKQQLSVFNWSVIGACGMVCLSYVFNMHVLLSAEDLEKYRLPLALVGVLGIEIVFLGVVFVLRNFWIFKPPRQGRREW